MLRTISSAAFLAFAGLLVLSPCTTTQADTLFTWVGSEIYRQDLSGGPATAIQRTYPNGDPAPAFFSRSQFGAGLEVVGDRLYMLEQSGWYTRVSSMDLDGKNYQWHQNFLSTGNSGYYSGFATDGNYAYALNTQTLRAEKLNLADGTLDNLAFILSGPGGGMDIDSTNGTLYYGRDSKAFSPTFTVPGFLGRSALDGSNFENHDRNVHALSIDIPNEKIYWSSGTRNEIWSGDLNLAPGSDFISNATLLTTLDGDGGPNGTGLATEMVYHASSNRLFYSAWNKPYVYALDLNDNSISKFWFTGNPGSYISGGIAIAETQIPEPSTMALGVVCALGALFWRSRSGCADKRAR